MEIGESIDLGQWMEKTTNAFTILMAEEEFWPTITGCVLYWFTYWWSFHQCTCAHLQPEDR